MQKKCKNCGAIYEAKGHKLYCSTSCQNTSKNKRAREKWNLNKLKYIKHPKLYGKERKCIICSKKFISDIRHPNQKTCSKKCSKKHSYERNKKEFLAKCKERYEKIKNTKEYKERVKLAARRWRKNNPEKAKENDRRFKQKHKEEILSKLRKYKLKERKCAICGTSFMPDKNHPLANCCSHNCRNELWAKNHPEKSKKLNVANSRRYRERHPEKIKEYTKKLVESGKAAINAKEWAKKNPEKIKEIRKRTYKKNKPKILARARAHKYQRRSILKKQIHYFGKKEQDYVKNRDESSCVYCRQKLDDENIQFDHIIPVKRKKGKRPGDNSVLNLVVCCDACNRNKQNLELDEWFKSDYCKEKKINPLTINLIVCNLIKQQKAQTKLN